MAGGTVFTANQGGGMTASAPGFTPDATTAPVIPTPAQTPTTYQSPQGSLMAPNGQPIAAPAGAQQSANGLWYINGQAYSLPPVTGGSPNYAGGGATMNANITTPANANARIAPPAVITSTPAATDLANKQAQTNQINQDAQTQAATKASAAVAAPTQTPETKTGGAPTDNSAGLETQISDLIGSLTTDQANITQQENAALSPMQKQQQEAMAQLDQQASYSLNLLNQISSGTYPLSPAEQSMLSSTVAVYQQTIAAQRNANTAYTGQMTEAMASLGISTSAPTQALGMIQATIDSGNSKIATLDAQMSKAVSDLTLAFQKQDYTMVNDAWNATSKYLNDRVTTLKDMQTQIMTYAQQQKADIKDATTTALSAIMDSNTISHNQKQDILAQATLDEKTRNDLETRQIAAFTAGMTGLGGGSTNNPPIPAATIGADGKVDPASQKAIMDAYTSMYGPQVAGMIKGLADYSINPADWRAGSTKGMSRATAVALAKQLDPTYSDTQYSIRAAYQKSLASVGQGTLGGAINAANKSINHLSAYVNTMATLGNAPSSTGNFLLNPVENLFDPARRQAFNAAQTEGLGVADELAKFFKGSGTTDVGSIDSWKAQLSTNASPADVKGLTQGAITLLAGQLETLSEQYKATMGKAPDNNFLGASATANLSKLKNEGYQVNIPGINYTDKDAYLKYDPSAQANMTTAVDQLTKAGLPLTPENILQLAQSQS